MITIARLTWDERQYEWGVDRGVFYPPSGPGEAWNGLIAVVEDPLESDEKFRYIDGTKRPYNRRVGEFAGTIEAVSYPPSFYSDMLTQRRSIFGMTYRTKSADSFQLHLVYNLLVSPIARRHELNFTDVYRMKFTTKPLEVPNAKRSAHLIVDGTIAYSSAVAQLEDLLYGSEGNEPQLPTPQEVFDVIEENSILMVIDHGDGTFTVTGPDSAILFPGPTEFEITWPSAVYIDTDTYTITSL